ncbi:MAG TPA: methylated-DNA--[protein]-cysteine S-methyltransferase [Devosiaceae bacterium]|jgi:methylated-DNA-[protein]-cysteine S-methyltransferase|nr:methylated-DNA--[protein]-cysteine S-methyltransferase [Devosiaceae bacterium]
MYYSLIDTAIGTIGIGWTERGVARVALPGADRAATEEAFLRHRASPGDADAVLAAAIAEYAEGEPVAFAGVALDLDGVPAFNCRVYDDIRRLGWGETTTYGAIARRLGDVNLSRAVGRALGDNPIPLIIPCHRVLAAGGRTGGFSAPGGVTAKMRMLALERAGTPDGQLAFGF